MSKLIVCVGLLIASPAMAGGNAKDEAAIKAAVTEEDAAWAKGDAKGIAAGYAENGTAVNAMGASMKGTADVEKQFAGLFAGPLKGSTHKMTVTRIKFVRPDVAVVDGDVEVAGMSGPDGKAMPPMKHHTTEVFAKEKGKWLITDNRGFKIMPPGAMPPGATHEQHGSPADFRLVPDGTAKFLRADPSNPHSPEIAIV